MISRNPYRPPVPADLATLFANHGIELLGISDCPPADRQEEEYRTWLEQGYHGDMRYLVPHAAMKYRPDLVLAGCRSILVAGVNYYQDRPKPAQGTGRVARYAWGRDYHRLIGKRLRKVRASLEEQYPGESFRSFTDATPLAERFYAERAGIAFTGRNTLSISSSYGSWFFIGEILCTVPFPPSGSSTKLHGTCPSGCSRCIGVCPTGALLAPHRIDASRCISYLTIENKGPIPESLRVLVGDWLFGCDLCQEVCPLNIRPDATREHGFLSHRAGADLRLDEVLRIETDEEFMARFAGSPVARAGRRGLVRNACVVAANIGAVELLPLLEQLSGESDALIAEHARWAVRQLRATE